MRERLTPSFKRSVRIIDEEEQHPVVTEFDLGKRTYKESAMDYLLEKSSRGQPSVEEKIYEEEQQQSFDDPFQKVSEPSL